MKERNFRLLIILLLFSISQFTYSQIRKEINPLNGNIFINIQGGLTLASTDYQGIGTNFGFKPSFEYFFDTGSIHTVGIKLFGNFGYLSGKDENKDINEFSTSFQNFGGGLTYSFMASPTIYPYLFAGVSYLSFDPKFLDGERLPNNALEVYKRGSVNYNIDLGMRVLLSQAVSLNFNFGANINPNDWLDDLELNGDNDMFFHLMLGASFSLQTQTDSDNDGVSDADDKCPRTPSGVRVDEFGCPIDSDQDGVPDYLDQCPNTPRYTKVDRKGCPLDSDSDGIADELDQCPNTQRGVPVDENGCPRDSDGDGIPDFEDQCPDTPPGTTVDDFGCPIRANILPPPVIIDTEPVTTEGEPGDYDYDSERIIEGNIFTDGNSYCVQQSAWRTESKADSQADALSNLGFNAFVVKKYFPNTGKTWYRVRIGFFNTIEEARRVQNQIR